MTKGFEDLLTANRRYSKSAPRAFDGLAHEGVLILTCMDSRLEPLEMVGLRVGEAKILRNAGAQVNQLALAAMAMGVHKLNVDRIMIVPHTKCAAASMTEEQIADYVSEASGMDAHWFHFGVDPDQLKRLEDDVETVRTHPLIGPFAEVGGFLYDVETGLLEQKF